ncbi:PREDICTED: apelin [Crocodylus porosus]|uniref:apelin n=1 Tax=Gavialis gangeticus TaxID=94835 RepID=UPI00092E3019|nr:PREDICTED: apelin [Gavialis gangeticus]XP_019391694.1 PREDICTED: apelin [Crocodylus porosus]
MHPQEEGRPALCRLRCPRLTHCLLFPGPLAEAPDGKDPEEGNIRNLVYPRGARNGAGHRQNGWRKYRRPRPRLSHKGPMPF